LWSHSIRRGGGFQKEWFACCSSLQYQFYAWDWGLKFHKKTGKAGTVQKLCIDSCFFIFIYTAEELLLIFTGAP